MSMSMSTKSTYLPPASCCVKTFCYPFVIFGEFRGISGNFRSRSIPSVRYHAKPALFPYSVGAIYSVGAKITKFREISGSSPYEISKFPGISRRTAGISGMKFRNTTQMGVCFCLFERPLTKGEICLAGRPRLDSYLLCVEAKYF